MVITSLRAVYIHYGCPSLPPCFVPHPYTTALVYQAGEQGYGLRMGFPRSHRGQVRDWSPVLSDSDPHAIKSRSEHFNWKGLRRKKKKLNSILWFVSFVLFWGFVPIMIQAQTQVLGFFPERLRERKAWSVILEMGLHF